MSEDSIYKKIEEIFGALPENFSILEEEIDVDVQMKYFELSRKNKRKKKDKDIVQKSKNVLFDPESTDEEKKNMLVKLASVDEVEAYRTIEDYLKSAEKSIKDWAVLALQENRILLENKLLDEDQVFISTGLGGKGNRLRYFVVLINKEGDDFTPTHKKVIKNEFESVFLENNITTENINFKYCYATILMLSPMDAALKEIIDAAIVECNQYGDFLDTRFIITNVKKLSFEEINKFISEQEDDDIIE